MKKLIKLITYLGLLIPSFFLVILPLVFFGPQTCCDPGPSNPKSKLIGFLIFVVILLVILLLPFVLLKLIKYSKEHSKKTLVKPLSYLFFYMIFLLSSLNLIFFFFSSFIASHLMHFNFMYGRKLIGLIEFATFPLLPDENGAYFIVSPIIVYLVWSFFMLVAFLAPAFLTKKIIKREKLKKSPYKELIIN